MTTTKLLRAKVSNAFTMIELLVVIAIIVILIAILFPVISNAKEAAYRTAAISNMHQCYIALSLYSTDDSYPSLDHARTVVPREVTWDKDDDWRSGPDDDWPLMLGSFGYAFSTGSFRQYSELSGGKPVPVLVSIFHEWPHVHAFQGDEPPSEAGSMGWNVAMPNRVICLRSDGAIKWENVPHAAVPAGEVQVFTWSSMWYALANKKTY